jgi:hypothetical protein
MVQSCWPFALSTHTLGITISVSVRPLSVEGWQLYIFKGCYLKMVMVTTKYDPSCRIASSKKQYMSSAILLDCVIVLLVRVLCTGVRPFWTRTLRGGNSVRYVYVHLPIQLGLIRSDYAIHRPYKCTHRQKEFVIINLVTLKLSYLSLYI